CGSTAYLYVQYAVNNRRRNVERHLGARRLPVVRSSRAGDLYLGAVVVERHRIVGRVDILRQISPHESDRRKSVRVRAVTVVESEVELKGFTWDHTGPEQ